MSSKVEKTENNVVTLEIKVSPEDFAVAMKKAYKKNVKRFNIPGFRKGKAPMKIIEMQYGEEVFYEDAFEFAFPEAYKLAIEENNLEPVAQPDIDVEKISKTDGLLIKAEVTVKPEVELGEYKGIEVEKTEYTVSDEDVETELKARQDQNARLITIEDRGVKEGDTVIIDFEGSIEGKTFEGGQATNYSLEIGAGQFIPGFEEQLIGIELGAEAKVEVTFPEEYQEEQLAGKPAIFEVKVNEIKGKELPELDDEFAKDISEFDTLEELKQEIKAEKQKQEENRIQRELEENILVKIVENASMEIPPAMIDAEVERMMQEFNYQLQSQGISIQDYFKYTNMEESDFKKNLEGDAKKNIEADLTFEKIIEVENIEATEEEIQEEVEKMAKQYGQEVEKMKETLQETQIDYIKNIIKRKKVMEFLIENSEIA